MDITIPITKLVVSTWQFNNEESDISYPVIVNDIAYFGASIRDSTELHYLCAVNVHTGESMWQVPNAGWCSAIPMVVEGLILSGGHDTYLYALDVQTGQILWQFKTDGKIKATPVIYDGIVYCGSADQYFYAVDAKTGVEKWRFKTERAIEDQATIGNGLVCFGLINRLIYILDALTGEQKYTYFGLMPTLVHDVLYLCQDDKVYAIDLNTEKEKWCSQVGLIKYAPVVREGTIFCINRQGIHALDETTGTQKWHYPCRVYEAPLFVKDLIYIGHGNYINLDHVRVLNVETGKEEWSFFGGQKQNLAVINNMLYMFTSKGSFSFLDLSNTALQQEIEYLRLRGAPHSYVTKWKFTIEKNSGAENRYNCTPVLNDGLLYCVSGEGYIYAIDAKTGNQQWQFKAAGGIYIQPVISEGLVYFVSHTKNILYAIDAKTGVEKWKFKSKELVSHTKFLYCELNFVRPLVANGVIYISCGHKCVYALDSKKGTEKWCFKPDDYALLTPIIVGDLIYIASFKSSIIHAVDIHTGISKQNFSMKQYSGGISFWTITNDFLYIVYEIYQKPAQFYALDIKKMEKGLTFAESLLWQVELIDFNRYLVALDKLVYYVSDKGYTIFALDYETSAERWKLQSSGYLAVGISDEMYVANANRLYLLDAKTGDVLTEWGTDVEIKSHFVKTENNIYFFDKDGSLTALELTATCRSNKSST